MNIAEAIEDLETFGDHIAKRFEIMEVFIYGDIAHVNREKRAVHTAWKSTQVFGYLEAAFVDIMRRTISIYADLAALNTVVLDHLRAINPKAQFTKVDTAHRARPDLRVSAEALRKFREYVPFGAFDMGDITSEPNSDGTITLRGTFTSRI